MSIFDINHGERIATALERIADALDRAVPPLPKIVPVPDEDATLINPTNEERLQWEREEELKSQGVPSPED